MLIKNLPKPIKELVFKRQIEQGNEPNEELTVGDEKSKGNFNFCETPECGEFWREINEGNYKPFFEKYGGVILCTSVEQGAKIIEYFKSLGVDTYDYLGSVIDTYYGFLNGKFDQFYEYKLKENNTPIFTLDELGVEQTIQQLGWQGENKKNVAETDENLIVSLKMQTTPYPELPEINFEGIEMEVSNNEVDWKRRKVLAKIKNQYLAFNIQQDSVFSWNYARPIAQKVKVTKEQIAEAFNTTVELLEIEP